MKMNNKAWIGAALALTGLTAGCGAKSVDIGDDTPPAVLGASLSDYQGTWVGYAELAEWSDGTDTVRLVLDANGNGVIEIGEADPLPPPVADEGYPPGQPSQPMLGVEPVNGLVSGFSYPVSGAQVESKRIRMSSSSGELFRDWCGLQEPVLTDNASPAYYNCLGSSGFSTGDTCTIGLDNEPIDCGLLACLFECTCDETSCEPARSSDDVRLDAALESEGEELEGSLDTPNGRFQVRMVRQ